jgi:DNA repair photolyase
VNPYRGCEHGCVYCYARPTHSYLNLSPGLDFETRLIAKRNIVEVLRADLGKRSYVPKLINIGSATDCYQPIERELKLTRSVIELMQEVGQPFSLVTKSSGVERDLDLIAPMAAASWPLSTSPSPRWTARWRASWSRARRRRTGGCAPYARWLSTACRSA